RHASLHRAAVSLTSIVPRSLLFLVQCLFFIMIRRPPRSTLFPLHDALPISVTSAAARRQLETCDAVPISDCSKDVLATGMASAGPEEGWMLNHALNVFPCTGPIHVFLQPLTAFLRCVGNWGYGRGHDKDKQPDQAIRRARRRGQLVL